MLWVLGGAPGVRIAGGRAVRRRSLLGIDRAAGRSRHLPDAVAADRRGLRRGRRRARHPRQPVPAGSASRCCWPPAAALAFQPAQRRLERLADRWVFGKRLDGYAVITRFGALLEASPGRGGPAAPARRRDTRRGSRVEWVACAPRPWPTLTGDASRLGDRPGRPADPAYVVPLVHAGTALGRIECGPRRDGPLLDEDRRLLAHLAGQAATAASNMRLTAELSDRLDVIRRQAGTDRVPGQARARPGRRAAGASSGTCTTAPQQDVVALTRQAGAGTRTAAPGRPARRRARWPSSSGTSATCSPGCASSRTRSIRRSSPTRGCWRRSRRRPARLPLEVVIEADPALRGVRYPAHIETTTWYVVAEALTNAVKHARAERVLVALAQPDGHLTVEVRDDGCGFDPGGRRAAWGWPASPTGSRSCTGRCASTASRGEEPRCTPRSRCLPPGGEAAADHLAAPRRTPPMAEPLRIVIADDNYLVREGTRRLLEDSGEVMVLAAVGSAPELLDAVRRSRPDAVLTDIRMPPAVRRHEAAARAARRWRASTRRTPSGRPTRRSGS